MRAMDPTPTTRNPGAPDPTTLPEDTMNTTTAPATNRFRKAVALVVALLLASLAFGVGLPWIIVDAPPEAETLWAREIQLHTAPALTMSPLAIARRAAGTIATR